MNKKLSLFVIISSSLITLMTSDIFLPSMPQIAEYFAVDNSKAQLSISLFLGGQILSTLFWGPLSDNIGRRKSFSMGMYLFFSGTIICILATNIYTFLLGRIIQGIGGVVAPVVGWALIQDMYPKDKSAGIMSWIGSIIALGPMIAPALGGQITNYFHWKGDFYFIAFITGIILIGLSALPRSRLTTKKMGSTKHAIKQYSKILTNKLFVSYVSLFALLACGQWCFLTMAPFLYENTMHLSADKVGFLMALSASFFIMGTTLASRLLNKLGIDRLISMGTKLSTFSGAILLGFHFTGIYNPIFTSLAFGFYLFCAALLWGASSSRALQCYEEQRGAASSIRSLLMIGFFAAGSYLGTLIKNDSLLDVSIILIILSISSISVHFSTMPEKSKITLVDNA
ncbi:multidrug effflux MFS transporter [Legionella longbeachae]|uniref:multidrug effflux MFS transporter n=1 Tax=Legionella longbeachae TaxID=450 RepID=UPI000F6E4DBE|nr:multidrug effflux MFS transporter [Legionella longbeachae]VEE02717.1 transporter of the major facilitator superfamily (MFS) [Legionella oakridgensis]